MFTRLGICSLLIGLFFALFSGISTFMGADNFWVGLTLSRILGEQKSEGIITFFSSKAIQNFLDPFFYSIPLFLLILGLAVILLVIGMFVKEH